VKRREHLAVIILLNFTQETTMRGCWTLALMIAVIAFVSACTSDPGAAVNQQFPIRQMDQFFNSMSRPPPPLDYTHQPGYAPAYPAYQN
jgi:hypothetical protein